MSLCLSLGLYLTAVPLPHPSGPGHGAVSMQCSVVCYSGQVTGSKSSYPNPVTQQLLASTCFLQVWIPYLILVLSRGWALPSIFPDTNTLAMNPLVPNLVFLELGALPLKILTYKIQNRLSGPDFSLGRAGVQRPASFGWTETSIFLVYDPQSPPFLYCSLWAWPFAHQSHLPPSSPSRPCAVPRPGVLWRC